MADLVITGSRRDYSYMTFRRKLQPLRSNGKKVGDSVFGGCLFKGTEC